MIRKTKRMSKRECDGKIDKINNSLLCGKVALQITSSVSWEEGSKHCQKCCRDSEGCWVCPAKI